MTESLFERFSNRATMMDAEMELLALGEDAVPVLESFFSGQAKDRAGVPWRERGLPMRCALEVARRLGPRAKALEPYLRSELRAGHFVAAMALGSLQFIDDQSVAELANCLHVGTDDVDLSFESAAALIRCGQAGHPLVVAAISDSEKAAKVFARVSGYLGSQRQDG